MTGLDNRVTVLPYAGYGTMPHDPQFMVQSIVRLQNRYREVATSILEDTMRQTVRRVVLEIGGLQFGGSSGGVYFIPDPTRKATYMEELYPFSRLVNWFGQLTRPNPFTGTRYRDEDGEIVPYYTARTTLRILGYIDSPRQLEYIRSDVTNALGSLFAEYYDMVLESLNVADPDEQEAFNETLDALLERKRVIQTRMETLQRTLGTATEVRITPFEDIQEGFDARLLSITSTSTRAAARVQELMEFGEGALMGTEEE